MQHAQKPDVIGRRHHPAATSRARATIGGAVFEGHDRLLLGHHTFADTHLPVECDHLALFQFRRGRCDVRSRHADPGEDALPQCLPVVQTQPLLNKQTEEKKPNIRVMTLTVVELQRHGGHVGRHLKYVRRHSVF
jgi:hypothetical protein